MKASIICCCLLSCLGEVIVAKAAEAPFKDIGAEVDNLRSFSMPVRVRSSEFTIEKRKGSISANSPVREAARDPGRSCIQCIWFTPAPLKGALWMHLQFFRDGEAEPSVEVPLKEDILPVVGPALRINSLTVDANLGSAFHCYGPMPFRKRARVMLENLNEGLTHALLSD
ncbi:MAG: DUF2961 domain-containing protein [Verrucomicrobiota bacterium]|nr:DUF2961 domain-containing protein [Limisphaera sp.]MDW8382292.1 DUF2961 domain-containing protein [Verrucomicrobiota bacterium]